MTNKTQWCRKTSQRYKLAKWAKCFSSDRLAQYCMNVSLWFTHETVSQGTHDHSPITNGFLFGMPFSVICTHAQLRSNILLKIAVLEIQLCATGHGIEELVYAFCLQSNKRACHIHSIQIESRGYVNQGALNL